MNAQLLIQAIVQQTMVFLAQLATAGGTRSPLTRLANQVFLDLSKELQNQGVRKNVIADMFGMTLRTYHRKVRELSQSRSDAGRSIWEAVLEFVKQHEPVSAPAVYQRFTFDDRDVVASVLNDLVDTGLCYRSGRGVGAIYRVADEADFSSLPTGSRDVAREYLVWQTVFRAGPVTLSEIASVTHLDEAKISHALTVLCGDGRVERIAGPPERFRSLRIDVPVGQANGWESAVFDHFQALVTAVGAKLAAGEHRSERHDLTGGATYTLDLWPDHPLRAEAVGMLERVRQQLEDLRARHDRVPSNPGVPPSERLVFYFGQHLMSDDVLGGETLAQSKEPDQG